MTSFECYRTYLALKNHFTKEKYDYFKYCRKIKSSLNSFYKRKDRFFFEKISRSKNDAEIENFFVSNFIVATDPQSIWPGDLFKNGEEIYLNWKKRVQSLSYNFTQESKNIFSENDIETIFKCESGHPILLKKFYGGSISIETIVIYEKIFSYIKEFDKSISDPVWENTKMKIQKYSPFLNADINYYRSILKKIIVGES